MAAGIDMGKLKQTAVAKIAQTVQVLCTDDHKLCGLFVIFKLVPPKGDAKQVRLARVLERSPDPGVPPVQPTSTGNAKKDQKAKAAYDARKKDYDEKKAAASDLPPDPADQYVVGIVDGNGFLQPIHSAHNPWLDIAIARDPDSYKLSAGEVYSCVLLRHPSPVLARALTRFVNGKPDPADAVYHFENWGVQPRDFTVESVSAGGGSQATLRFSESAADYVPSGSARYGGWVLYNDMPHSQCGAGSSAVESSVRQLQEDLGQLRYPAGKEDRPYRANPKDILSLKLGAKPKDTVNIAVFDGQVQAAVARLREHQQAGQAFTLSHATLAHGGKDWAYALGQANAPTPSSPPGGRIPAVTPIGVVDEATATVIAFWLDNQLRKPGEVLLCAQGRDIWLLERGALAVLAWSALTKAFGCRYGVRGGSSLRSVSVGAWPGAVLNSVHKTGLAIDLSGGGNRSPSREWPIRYESHWSHENQGTAALERANKLIAAAKGDPKKTASAESARQTALATIKSEADDEADGKLGWTQRWRLYGHSELNIFDDTARPGELTKLRSAVADYAGLTLGDGPPPDGFVRGRGLLWKNFAKSFGNAIDDDMRTWLDAKVAPFVSAAVELLRFDADRLVEDYFRSSVVQFRVNAYERDGGTAGKRYLPQEGDDEFPAVEWALSWVNLSALGWLCGMDRIGPHQDSVRDQTWIRGPSSDKSASKDWPIKQFFKVKDDEDTDIVVMLSDITATEAEAPQLQQRDTHIPIVRNHAIVAKHKPADVRGTFIKEWRTKITKLDRSLRPSDRNDVAATPQGAQIGLVLSALPENAAQRKPLDDAIALLAGTFADEKFVAISVGTLASKDVPGNAVVTGSALAGQLKAALTTFSAQATANTKSSAPPTPPPAARPRKTAAEVAADRKTAHQAADRAERQTATDWTVIVQPVFVSQPDVKSLTFLPDDFVRLPPGSNANHLEWWHFQHASAGPNWGALLEECGYSLDVMKSPKAGVGNADGKPVHRGLGYSEKDVHSTPWGKHEGTIKPGVLQNGVENRDAFTPPGG